MNSISIIRPIEHHKMQFKSISQNPLFVLLDQFRWESFKMHSKPLRNKLVCLISLWICSNDQIIIKCVTIALNFTKCALPLHFSCSSLCRSSNAFRFSQSTSNSWDSALPPMSSGDLRKIGPVSLFILSFLERQSFHGPVS